MTYHLKLVSFKLCPFVQRAIITLNHKQVDYDITYIDLANKPDWFHEISPFGKVPVLLVNDEEAIFESAVINEFISDIFPPALHPADPVRRAHNRAWIEYSSYILGTAFRMQIAPSEAAFNEYREKLHKQLLQLEKQLGDGPFFNGEQFCLIDASYAPFFVRQEHLDRLYFSDVYRDLPKVKRWSETLLMLPEVQTSIVPEFGTLFGNYLTERSAFVNYQPA